ncbi:TldD/PmbA family protein [Solicola sp. PLA-1-18]|uniref:TldD/PmbA family protein n=1 Tax=Solicola sp. PLA-1-18 TaxID=3380532 RepID=UPI003B812CE1
MAHEIDPEFLAIPLRSLADAALQRARDLGADHADVRIERIRSEHVSLRDGALQGAHEGQELGLCVRVVADGVWGFASTGELSTDAAVRAAETAIAVARVSAPVTRERIELAPEPSHGDRTWVSDYEVDPLTVPLADKVALTADRSQRLLAHGGVDHVSAGLGQVVEQKFYADLAGTSTTQQRVRIEPSFEAYGTSADGTRFDSMASLAPPVGRGWEYVTGGWDFDTELAELGDHLAAKLEAPSIEPGTYDLVIDPTNLWLTIHESVGHATELDRALGYEANYAGTSFATWDQLGALRYGSEHMNVTGDRTEQHGLSTIGFDDDGVETQSWDLVRDGTLVGYQLDRRTAALKGFDRSNGCAFADSPSHVPVQRMANVSLLSDPSGPDTAGLVSGVSDGIYAVGNRSWSIDMQRFNFQFTGQRFFRIKDGRLAGQVRDVAYQATTTDFWGRMAAVGGPSTVRLGGTFNCGKAQPGQGAPVSHGCPSALFTGITILNTAAESGR